MISTQQAYQWIQERGFKRPSMVMPFQHTMGCVLAQSVASDSPLPPFHRVMMDGIAIRYDDYLQGCESFRVQGIQSAGAPPQSLIHGQNCLEVMTGAVCPLDADTVIPYEHLRIQDDQAQIQTPPQRLGQNIHPMGSDRQQGEILLHPGCMIGPAEMGVLASVGLLELLVYPKPTIAICSTGDELVEVTETPLAHQIRRSNVYAVAGALQARGFTCSMHHVEDNRETIRKYYEAHLSNTDVVIWSGGVSAGKFDFIPEVMKELNIQEVFHRIEQRPGKPMWFGVGATQTVFGLPGNPVSSLACLARYVIPWLTHQNQFPKIGVCNMPAPHPKLTLLVPVKLNERGEYEAIPHRGSGDFSSLQGLAGFVEYQGQERLLSLFALA